MKLKEPITALKPSEVRMANKSAKKQKAAKSVKSLKMKLN